MEELMIGFAMIMVLLSCITIFKNSVRKRRVSLFLLFVILFMTLIGCLHKLSQSI